jgi:hypothetical protein
MCLKADSWDINHYILSNYRINVQSFIIFCIFLTLKELSMKKNIIFTLFFAFSFFLACTPPPKVEGEASIPQDKLAEVQKFTPIASVINVPMEIRTSVVEKMLNTQLNDTLYASDTLTINGIKPVKIRVFKYDTIKISLNGDELEYKVPLKIWLQFQFTVGALGLSHTEYQEVEAGIALKFRSRLFIKNDWKIVTMTKADGYEWLSDPVIKVRFITIPFKPIADLVLSKQQDSFGAIVDKAVSDLLDAKKLIQPLWNKMQVPIKIADDPLIWLKLTPLGIYMTQLEGRDGVIRSSVGIKSIAETYLREAPVADTTAPLPEFIVPGKIDSGFVINLYCEINYQNASTMMNEYLQGRSFSSGKHEIVILNVDIYGIDGYAVVALELTGSYVGKVYVIGKVVFDTKKSTVSIEDLEFDVKTDNALHKSAEWLFHDIIISKVKPFLKFPMRENLLESQLMVQKMLCNHQVASNVVINGAIDSLAVGGVRFTQDAIQAVILSKGSLTLKVQE